MKKQAVQEAYFELLIHYIDNPQEEALAAIAELGHELALANISPEDIGEIHAEAIRRVLGKFSDATSPGAASLGPIPLIKMLMAYGLALRAQSTAHQRVEDAQRCSERLEDMAKESTKKLRDAQEQLVRREKLVVLSRMARSVGHELRNPMGTISNAVYYLNIVLADADETTREYLDMIASEVHRSNTILADQLDLVRIRPVKREEIALSTLVAQALLKQPPPEGVQVRNGVASDLPPVYVDPEQIGGQVLVNLLANAYQAMPKGGELIISAQAEQDEAAISIADTGCGIPPENVEKIFELLFTTKSRGIGLGLAISESLMLANGGSIEVASDGVPGQGSTFTIKLPLAQARPGNPGNRLPPGVG